jgi:hypothetical protein
MVKMVINGFGAVCTFVVMIVFAVTKFSEGAWIVIILTPLLVTVFFTIHHHYKSLAKQLSLENGLGRPRIARDRVIILVGGVHQGTLAAIRFARTISDDITAVHIATDPQEAEKVERKWAFHGEGIRLVSLNSPYRLMIEPLLEYLERLEAVRKQNEVITIVVPRFIPKHWWANLLHMRTAETLRKMLLNRDDIVIVEVPYQVH